MTETNRELEDGSGTRSGRRLGRALCILPIGDVHIRGYSMWARGMEPLPQIRPEYDWMMIE